MEYSSDFNNLQALDRANMFPSQKGPPLNARKLEVQELHMFGLEMQEQAAGRERGLRMG